MKDPLIKKEFDRLKAAETIQPPAFDRLYQAAQGQARRRRNARRYRQIAATLLVLVLAGTFWLPSRGKIQQVEADDAGRALSNWSAPTDQSLSEKPHFPSLSDWQSPTEFLMPAAN